MNAGLVYLLRKQPLGMLRQLRRRLRGIKGILMAVAIGIFLVAVIAPSLVMVALGRSDESAQALAELRTWGPAASLLALLLTGLSSRALYFKPSEVDFLFPAPIRRKDLLLFNVISRLKVQIGSGLFCSIFFMRHAGRWYSGLTAIVLALVFLQLTAQCSGLFFSTLSEALGKRIRRAALVVLAVSVVGGVVAARTHLLGTTDFVALLRTVVDYPLIWVVTWITRPFVELFIAESLGPYFLWSSVALTVLVLEVFVMMMFDIAYTERAAATSRKVEDRLRRMTSGGGAFAAFGHRRGRFALPQFPRLAGAGALAWRQCVELSRNLRSILMTVCIMLFPMFGLSLMPSLRDPDSGTPEKLYQIMIFLLVFLSFMLSQHVLFDFRRDVDRMDFLKSLPLSNPAIAIGQLVAPVLLLTMIQSLAVAVVVFLSPSPAPGWIVAAPVVLVPLNWINIALENSIFLFFPYRMTPKDPGSFQFMGRLMLVVMLKMLILAVFVGFSALVGLLAWLLTSSELATALLIGGFLALMCVPVTFLVAMAFRRFDVTKDVPA